MKLSGSFLCFGFFFGFFSLVCAYVVVTILTRTVINTYTVYSYPLRYLKDDHQVIILTDKTPTQERLATPPGVYLPCSFRTVVWVLLCPTRTR